MDIRAAAGPAFDIDRPARGLAVGDLDGDGRPEIVIVNMNAPPSLLKNEASARQNRAFHFAIYRQSGSTVLLPIIESLWLQFGPYLRHARLHDRGARRGVRYHEQIVEALQRRDAATAVAALEGDVDLSFGLVLDAPEMLGPVARKEKRPAKSRTAPRKV